MEVRMGVGERRGWEWERGECGVGVGGRRVEGEDGSGREEDGSGRVGVGGRE